MRIVCPQCGYSRDIPSEKVPASSSIATCPKCQFRFRFRGNQPSVQPEPAVEEPVYPPRPSRPVRPAREPESASRIHAPYEPRSQRAYMPDAQGDPEHYGHIPPRPQARWLPDDEPDQFTARPSRPERHIAWEPSGELPDPADDGSWREPQPSRPAPATPPIDRVESAIRRAQDYDYRPEPRQPQPPQTDDLRPQASPDEFGRLGAGPAVLADPAGLANPADPVDKRDREPLPREYAMPSASPAPGQPVSGQDVQHGQDDDQASQPGEAVAGEDSVRDIWARLQAMGTQPPQGRAASANSSRQSQDEPGMEAHQPKAELPYAVAPWEQLELYGAVPSFLNTVKTILLKPGDFFDQLPPFSGKIRPLLFANVVCLASMIFGLIWFRFGLGPNLSDLGRTDGFQGLGAGMIGSLAWLGLSPILVTAFVFLDAALGHLLLGLLRSASKPFEETFRTVCYAGAPWMLTVLPVSWQYLIPVVLIWHMTLQAIGLKKLHQAGYPQVLASVLVKWSLYFMASFAVLHVLLTRR